MVDDFLKDVILVLIPVAAGVIFTTIITHRWQTRSAKIKIKKEILECFAKSAQLQFDILHQFVGLFVRTYGKADSEKYDFDKAITTFEVNIPLIGEQVPKIKLQEDYQKMNQLYEQAKLSSATVFVSLLRLYYRDEGLGHEHDEIQKKLGYIRNIIYELMQDPKPTGYIKLGEEYLKERHAIHDVIKYFSKKLVENDITI